VKNIEEHGKGQPRAFQSYGPGGRPLEFISVQSHCLISIRPPSLLGDLSSNETSQTREIIHAQGASFSAPWHLQRVLTLCGTDESCGRATTIGMLTDHALLEIFDFYRKNHPRDQVYDLNLVWEWHLLVQVCRRWRQIIFESPHRLNLQILCTHRTPARKNLGIWPTFPIVIAGSWSSLMPNGEENLIAALEHLDRVRCVKLYSMSSQLGKIATVMQKPFPLLTRLDILSDDRVWPLVLPAEFLGGSAPCLQNIALTGVPYPALPTLLLSTSDLVTLELRRIPSSGYISPEAMVVGLAALPKLETFILELQAAIFHPDRTHPPHITTTVLPALAHFVFQGAYEYLEDFVAQIDSPQLNRIHIHYSNDLVDVAQLSKFVDRSVGPKLSLFKHAGVSFFGYFISIAVYHHADRSSSVLHPARTMTFGRQGINMAEVFSQFSATLSNVVHLKLQADPEELPDERDDVEWFLLLRQFSTVQTLHVSREIAEDVAHALEVITGEMVTEVLPSLDLIYLAGQRLSSVWKFVAARRLSGRPVTVVNTITEFKKRHKSYVRYQLRTL
jgi:hypothetical protein